MIAKLSHQRFQAHCEAGQDGLVEEVHPQGPAAQGAQGAEIPLTPGESALAPGIDPAAQGRAQQEEAQVGQQGKIVRRYKPLRAQAQGDQPQGNVKGIPPDHQPGGDEDQPQRRQPGAAQPPQDAPQQHADPQAVQHAKIDDDAFVRQAQAVHARGNGRAQQPAGKHLAAPPDAMAAQGHADAGDHQEHKAAVIFDKQKPPRLLPAYQARQPGQIIDEMDDQHTQQGKPPGGVQLPDPFFHPLLTAALASSSSTR